MPYISTRLDDGFSTIITFAGAADPFQVYERDVTPPSWNAGGAVDVTTMRSTSYRTQSPKKLKSVGNIQATVAYSAISFSLIEGAIGLIQSIVVTFPDGAYITFFGWIDSFVPSALQEGAQPTAVIVVIPSNHDVGSIVEAGPATSYPDMS